MNEHIYKQKAVKTLFFPKKFYHGGGGGGISMGQEAIPNKQ